MPKWCHTAFGRKVGTKVQAHTRESVESFILDGASWHKFQRKQRNGLVFFWLHVIITYVRKQQKLQEKEKKRVEVQEKSKIKERGKQTKASKSDFRLSTLTLAMTLAPKNFERACSSLPPMLDSKFGLEARDSSKYERERERARERERLRRELRSLRVTCALSSSTSLDCSNARKRAS